MSFENVIDLWGRVCNITWADLVWGTEEEHHAEQRWAMSMPKSRAEGMDWDVLQAMENPERQCLTEKEDQQVNYFIRLCGPGKVCNSSQDPLGGFKLCSTDCSMNPIIHNPATYWANVQGVVIGKGLDGKGRVATKGQWLTASDMLRIMCFPAHPRLACPHGQPRTVCPVMAEPVDETGPVLVTSRLRQHTISDLGDSMFLFQTYAAYLWALVFARTTNDSIFGAIFVDNAAFAQRYKSKHGLIPSSSYSRSP